MPPREPTIIQCAVSGETLAAHSAIWLVRHPEGHWVVDIAGKLPGERIAISPTREALGAALAEKGFSTQEIKSQLERTEAQLRKETLNWLPLAQKAGILVTGFDTVGKALRNGELALLIQAGDASEDGIRKLAGIAKSLQLPATIRSFGQETLSQALGRPGAMVHLGLRPGAIAKSFLSASQRLAGFSPQHGL